MIDLDLRLAFIEAWALGAYIASVTTLLIILIGLLAVRFNK